MENRSSGDSRHQSKVGEGKQHLEGNRTAVTIALSSFISLYISILCICLRATWSLVTRRWKLGWFLRQCHLVQHLRELDALVV